MTLILLQAKLPDIYLDVPFEKNHFPIISQCLANSHESKLVPFIAGYLMNNFTKADTSSPGIVIRFHIIVIDLLLTFLDSGVKGYLSGPGYEFQRNLLKKFITQLKMKHRQYQRYCLRFYRLPEHNQIELLDKILQTGGEIQVSSYF